MAKQRDNGARLQALLDTAACGIITIDERGTIETANPACERLFGCAREALIGQNVRVLMPSPYREEHDGYLARYLETGEKRIIGVGREVEARHYDGSVFPVYLSVSEFRVDGKRMFTGIVDDISARKHAEDELRDRIRQQQVVAELGVEALGVLDLDKLLGAAVTRVAEALDVEFAKILELQRGGDAFVLRAGVGWRDGLVGCALVDADGRSQAGYTLATDAPVIVEDLTSETRFSPPPLLSEHGITSGVSVVIAGEGRPFGVFGVHTKQRRVFRPGDAHFVQSVANLVAEAIRGGAAREKLTLQENLVRLGELAAIVAHEVRNTQAGVSGALRVISRRLPGDSTEQEVIGEMLRRLESLNRFMGDVLNFARPLMPALTDVSVKVLLDDIMTLMREDARWVGVDVILDCDAIEVPCDLQMIRPVIVNLLVNSAEAMGGSGKIAVEARACEKALGARCCRISVTDDGPGIPVELRERVFEPFFSTKRRGSGLGLPLAKRVVELHGGRIEIHCPQSGGTRVVLELPIDRRR